MPSLSSTPLFHPFTLFSCPQVSLFPYFLSFIFLISSLSLTLSLSLPPFHHSAPCLSSSLFLCHLTFGEPFFSPATTVSLSLPSLTFSLHLLASHVERPAWSPMNLVEGCVACHAVRSNSVVGPRGLIICYTQTSNLLLSQLQFSNSILTYFLTSLTSKKVFIVESTSGMN